MMELTFYTTEGCHLCEEAEALLVQVQLPRPVPVSAVDISECPDLVERYGTRIPVLRRSDSGRELSWPFSAEDVQHFVTADS